MPSFTESFAGQHITVISGTGGAQERTDTGTLVAISDAWIQLAKDNGEMLLFPHAAIRVVKLLDVAPPYTATKEDFINEPLRPPPPRETPA